MQADPDGGSEGNNPGRCDEKALHAYIDGFSFELLAAELESHFGSERDAPGSPLYLLDGGVRGAHQAKQTVPINGLVKEKAGAGFEPVGDGIGVLIVAKQDDWSQPVVDRIAQLPRKFGTIRLCHLIIQKRHRKSPAAQNRGSFRACRKTHGFDAHRAQDLFDEVTCTPLIVNDEGLFLHGAFAFYGGGREFGFSGSASPCRSLFDQAQHGWDHDWRG